MYTWIYIYIYTFSTFIEHHAESDLYVSDRTGIHALVEKNKIMTTQT